MSKTDKPTLDAMRQELHELVAWFEGDDFVPEQAADKFARAEAIVRSIETELDEQKNRISVLAQRFDIDEEA